MFTKKPQNLAQIMSPLSNIKAQLHKRQNTVTSEIDTQKDLIESLQKQTASSVKAAEEKIAELTAENELINTHLSADIFKAFDKADAKKASTAPAKKTTK